MVPFSCLSPQALWIQQGAEQLDRRRKTMHLWQLYTFTLFWVFLHHVPISVSRIFPLMIPRWPFSNFWEQNCFPFSNQCTLSLICFECLKSCKRIPYLICCFWHGSQWGLRYSFTLQISFINKLPALSVRNFAVCVPLTFCSLWQHHGDAEPLHR